MRYFLRIQFCTIYMYQLVILMLFCSIEVYGMKTDVIKEALESVKKEDPK